MKMFSRFLEEDSGAITVDWVTLTAGVLIAGIVAIYAIFNNGMNSLVTGTNSNLTNLVADLDPGTATPLNP